MQRPTNRKLNSKTQRAQRKQRYWIKAFGEIDTGCLMLDSPLPRPFSISGKRKLLLPELGEGWDEGRTSIAKEPPIAYQNSNAWVCGFGGLSRGRSVLPHTHTPILPHKSQVKNSAGRICRSMCTSRRVLRPRGILSCTTSHDRQQSRSYHLRCASSEMCCRDRNLGSPF